MHYTTSPILYLSLEKMVCGSNSLDEKEDWAFTTQKANLCVKCSLCVGSVYTAHGGLPDVVKTFEFIVNILKSGDFTHISGLLTSREQSGDLGWWVCILAQGQQAGAESWSWVSASIVFP